MMRRSWYFLIAILLLSTGCDQGNFPFFQGGRSATPTKMESTPTLTPPSTPTSTPELVEIPATVWVTDPIVPVITFHQFKPDGTPSDTSGHKMTLGDLKNTLQKLYDSGFSLISLSDWISGNLSVPEGRRPLILTMDDLFFRNQILLDDSGQPRTDTGIGVIWQFSQEHPNFGFHLSLFAVMGDKYFPSDPQYDPDWESKMVATIVWCLENSAMVYNHTYLHGYLSNVENPISMTEFLDQLRQNDEAVRYFLNLAGRQDLIPLLGNIIALPGGAQPQSEADWESLREYKNPEGVSVQAILGIASAAADPARLEYLASPYNTIFNKFRIPRLVANLFYLDFLDEHNTEFPEGQVCTLKIEKSRLGDDQILSEQIGFAVDSGACPAGLYYAHGLLFDARVSPIQELFVME
jgi:hypothetical protein